MLSVGPPGLPPSTSSASKQLLLLNTSRGGTSTFQRGLQTGTRQSLSSASTRRWICGWEAVHPTATHQLHRGRKGLSGLLLLQLLCLGICRRVMQPASALRSMEG